ncbi:hypothetical protein [Haloarchaeobius sp. TZWWS8]|uniref:hypothetical protein n=1 Tax=Haloarchaeobius sp. TZWWS8 TaxID=3446121 RepID=UPI003EBE365B
MATRKPRLCHVSCPFDDCTDAGKALIPHDTEVSVTVAEPSVDGKQFDGMVRGGCAEHQFYVYFQKRHSVQELERKKQ